MQVWNATNVNMIKGEHYIVPILAMEKVKIFQVSILIYIYRLSKYNIYNFRLLLRALRLEKVIEKTR